MAEYQIECPECESILRPTKPLTPGKTVKCPRCGHPFKVPAPAKAKVGADKKKTPGKKTGPEEEEAMTYRVVDEGLDQEERDEKKPKINYAPDMSIKDLRGPAQAMVIQPSNKLMLAGTLGFLGWLGLLIVILIPVLFPLPEYQSETTKDQPKGVLSLGRGFAAVKDEAEPGAGAAGQKKGADEDKPTEFFNVMGMDLALLSLFAWYMFLVCLLPMVLGMIYSGLLTYGAVKMQNLESRAWGIVACVMAIIPINHLGFIALTWLIVQFLLLLVMDGVGGYLIFLAVVEGLMGVAVGIWGLIVLMKQEVIDGFNYVAE
jgi:hypothetical protein